MDDLWRQPFELAWQSLKLGSFPVGATLHNPAGQVILAGRNRAAEQSAPPGHLFGTTLAHGELDVLGQLEPGDYADHTLYTTLQPCLFCQSAIRLARVGTVVYAGADPLWDATAAIPALLPELLAARWPTSEGPATGTDGLWGSLLTGIWLVTYRPDAVAEPTELIPWATVELARRCVAAKILDCASMDEAYGLAESLG